MEGGYNVSRTLCCRTGFTNVICAESTTFRVRGHGTHQEGAHHVYRYYDVCTTRVDRCIPGVTDTVHSATYTTQNHLASYARTAVDNVSAETDTTILATSLRSCLALSIPSSILYYNYHVGECQDLIFGVSLADYATARGIENDVPKILRICIDEIDKRGLDAEGIYRVSTSK